MHDDLTKPLGLDSGAARPRLAALWPAALAVACFAVGAGLYAAYDRLSADPPAPAQTAAIENNAAAVQQVGETQPPQDKSGAADLADAQDEPLEAAKPDGAIEPLVPVPVFRRQESGLAHLPDPDLVEKGATGVIPKRSADGLRPMDVYSRPPATEGNFGVARVVLIVGGIGISQTGSQEAIRKLPPAITLAFAPYGNSLLRWMQEARKSGHELLLQVPMEPFDYPSNNPGPHTLRSGVSAPENIANLHWAMSRITNYVGIVNFLGGKFIADPDAMKPVFDEIAARGLLFVDDGSIRNSMSDRVAQASLLPFSQAGVQIDAVRTRQAIGQRLEELAKEAKRTGLAIGFANAFSDSISMIAEFAAQAEKNGIEITPVSAVVRDPQKGQ
jgi:polysaccharide deacetylase 2 family uncharacterized protein YibQ